MTCLEIAKKVRSNTSKKDLINNACPWEFGLFNKKGEICHVKFVTDTITKNGNRVHLCQIDSPISFELCEQCWKSEAVTVPWMKTKTDNEENPIENYFYIINKEE